MDHRSMHRRRGFTLIELLVVIAIIGILATLVVTQLGSARIKARNSSAKSDNTEGGKAIEVYKNDDAAAGNVIIGGANSLSTSSDTTLAYATGGALSATMCTGVTSATSTTACAMSSLNSAGTGAGAFTNIFTGAELAGVNVVAAPVVNTYGVKFTKTPGTGIVYYYVSDDSAFTTPVNSQSALGNYYFVVDLGAANIGAGLDTSRYYYVHNGVSGNNGATTPASVSLVTFP